MQKRPGTVPQVPTSRAEKLSILSSLLGPEGMERVRGSQTDSATNPKTEQVEINADRVAWHRNRLLERLRQHGGSRPDRDAAMSSGTPAPAARAVGLANGLEPPRDFSPVNASLDARLAKISDLVTLGQEHPAIITRLMKTLSRDERVEALKSLPGPLARSVVRRLR